MNPRSHLTGVHPIKGFDCNMASIRKINAGSLTYRHFFRYCRILSVLIAYGFDDLPGIFRIQKYIKIGVAFFQRDKKKPIKQFSKFERIRMAMEELGPTFIKLGQVLSMRPDFVDIRLINELAKLQDAVPSFPLEQIRETVKAELGKEIEDLYDQFDESPIASASIGQVHKAFLKDGREVAVKIQRPGIAEIVSVDIGIMYHLAGLLENRIEEVAFIRPVSIVDEFARTIAKELDYNVEADHMERFASDFADIATIHIPSVYREYTTQRVLTMEMVHGIKVSDISGLDRASIDKKLITKRGADMLLKQIFENGFFHADPHSGNIYIKPDNTIILFDFGMVGAVDQQTKEDFVSLLENVMQKNAYAATQKLLDITFWEKKPDTRLLEKDVASFISKHLYATLKELKINDLIQDLLHMVSRHQLRVPPDIFLIMKALATIEGIAGRLDPDFDMIEHASPFIKKIKLERLRPWRVASDMNVLMGEMAHLSRHLPSDVKEIIRLVRERQLCVQMDERSISRIGAAQHKSAKLISLSIIASALIIGSSLLIMADRFSLLGIIGIFASIPLVFWLLISTFRGQ